MTSNSSLTIPTIRTTFIVHLVGVNKEDFDDVRMHGMEYFKIIDAQQAKLINYYNNAKHKLL